MKYKELAQAYFPNAASPEAASVALRTCIKKNKELREKYEASLGTKNKARILTKYQINLIKSHLGPIPSGRKKIRNSVEPDKTKPVKITGVTLHRGSEPGLKIEWEEKDGKIFIGGIEIETVNTDQVNKRKESPEYERVIETMALMQKDRGNCVTLDPRVFPSLLKYKTPTHFAQYCIQKYFKKYPHMKNKEAFKAKVGLAPGTARIIKIA